MPPRGLIKLHVMSACKIQRAEILSPPICRENHTFVVQTTAHVSGGVKGALDCELSILHYESAIFLGDRRVQDYCFCFVN